MSQSRETIERWIERQMKRGLMLLCVEHRTNSRGPDVIVCKVDEKSSARELAADIESAIDDHARGIARGESGSGWEQYLLQAVAKEDSKTCATLPISRQTGGPPAPNGASDPITTEPPTAMGALGQSMRQGESWHEFNLKMAQGTFGALGNILTRLAGMYEKGQADNFALLEFFKETQLRQTELSHQMILEQENAKMKTAFLEGAVKHAPALLAMMTGRPVPVDDRLVSELFDSLHGLTPDEAKKVLDIILPKMPPTLASVFMAKWAEVEEKKNAAKKGPPS